MSEIGIGIIGGGYMGKAHSVAYSSVGAVFATKLRPRLEMIAASTQASAERYRQAFGYNRAAADWLELVDDKAVDAVIIACPQEFHHDIALRAISLGKPVFCEKPLGKSLQEARSMAQAAQQAGVINMIGFNYIRTPASQFARKLLAEGEIGDLTFFRGENAEDFYCDPAAPASWRTQGRATGTMGDLAPHMINGALALVGDIESLVASVETVHKHRPDGEGNLVEVTNDDQAQMMCRFDNGVMGHLFFSRVATGRKMGYTYEIHGTKGAIRFDQEDQNALWLYKREGPESHLGYRKILTGPAHPDYVEFCLGPGHGTGYQDQIIIEAKDFLTAIETGQNVWPTFEDGVAVSRIVEAAHHSSDTGNWVNVQDF